MRKNLLGVEAIAVEVFRQCECSGTAGQHGGNQSCAESTASASADVPMWALRRDSGESESRPCLSCCLDVAAVGGRDTSTWLHVSERPSGTLTIRVPLSLR